MVPRRGLRPLDRAPASGHDADSSLGGGSSMKPLRVVFLVLGSICALIGLGLLAAGGVVGWAEATQRDDAGYFTTSTQRFHTRTAAITTRDIDLGTPGPDDWWSDRDLATVRIRVASATARP